jgi:hypothetical protein
MRIDDLLEPLDNYILEKINNIINYDKNIKYYFLLFLTLLSLFCQISSLIFCFYILILGITMAYYLAYEHIILNFFINYV